MAKRLCLVDDLKMLKITMSNTSSRNKLNPEINDHYNILTGECQKDELKTKDKAFSICIISSSSQNVAFVSENTSSTNDVSTANSVSNTSSQNPQYEQTSSYSLLANQSSCPQLDHEDLEQLDEYDLEEMDLKWQVAMISMRMKKTGKKEDSKALVTIDGEGVDWTSHSEEDEDYALMACNSSESDTEREQLSDASIEIKAYSQGLKKVEAQLVAHQQGQLWYEQKIKFMKIDLDDKTDVLTYHKKLVAEAQKEKEDLKAKGRKMA
ncbi:hypothetical protein Tco_0921111 [Tanacetum coccineum]